MVDCGRSASFSPARYIANNIPLTPFNNRKLAQLVITHPHDDHVADINNVKSLINPWLLKRGSEYDWNGLIKPPLVDMLYRNLYDYVAFQSEYIYNATETPNWGFDLSSGFGLSVDEAKNINENNYVNNSSIPVVIEYLGWKIFIPGDIEEDGFKVLVKKPRFAKSVEGTDFYIASHHGLTSGFSNDLFEIMGKPRLNIISESSKNENVDKKYSAELYSNGIDSLNPDTDIKSKRRMVSTRKDGTIIIQINSDRTCTVYPEVLQDNE